MNILSRYSHWTLAACHINIISFFSCVLKMKRTPTVNFQQQIWRILHQHSLVLEIKMATRARQHVATLLTTKSNYSQYDGALWLDDTQQTPLPLAHTMINLHQQLLAGYSCNVLYFNINRHRLIEDIFPVFINVLFPSDLSDDHECPHDVSAAGDVALVTSPHPVSPHSQPILLLGTWGFMGSLRSSQIINKSKGFWLILFCTQRKFFVP